jgi:hypothetical protein
MLMLAIAAEYPALPTQAISASAPASSLVSLEYLP